MIRLILILLASTTLVQGQGLLLNPYSHSVPAGGSPDPIWANVFYDFEDGANGDSISTNYLNTTNRVGWMPGYPFLNSWTNTGTTATLTTNYASPIANTFVVGGTNYSTTNSIISLAFTNGSAGTIEVDFPVDERMYALTVMFDFMTDMPSPEFTNGDIGTYDWVQIPNYLSPTEFSVFQSQSFNFRAHSSGTNGTGISWERLKWYHVELTGGLGTEARIHVYDSNMVLLAQSQSTFGSTNANGAVGLDLGNVTPHGFFPAGNIYFDNVAVLWTNTGDCFPSSAMWSTNDTANLEGSNLSQRLTLAGETLCSFQAYIYATAPTNVFFGLFDAPSGGNQVGTTVGPVLVTTDAIPVHFDIANPVPLTGTYYARCFTTNGVFRWRVGSSGNYSGGAAYSGGSLFDSAYDYKFVGWVE